MKKIFYAICISLIFGTINKNNCLCNETLIQNNYKPSETISLDNFLYAKEAPKNWKHLRINKNDDVTYRGKVIIDTNGQTINNSSTSYLYIKIYIIASGGKPRKGCDETDYYKNGIYGLGCYMDIPDE